MVSPKNTPLVPTPLSAQQQQRALLDPVPYFTRLGEVL